jgi:predicted transcriptional regulator
MLRVRDIMTREVVSLAGDAPLEVAAWRLASEAVSGAPVRDARGNLIGVLSKSDLVDLMREPGNARRVKDAMTPAVWAVHPDAPAIEAVELMVEKSIHRVLVVRGPSKLEGIVTSMDVMRALAEGGQFHDDEARQGRDSEDEDESLTRAGAGK